MTYIYQEITPTLIENTVMQLKVDENSNGIAYRITPIEGYVLHDKNRDWYDINEETGIENEEPTLGYTTGTATCNIDYDFDKNERCFCTERAEDISENQIF
jgi:hypothetical protein